MRQGHSCTHKGEGEGVPYLTQLIEWIKPLFDSLIVSFTFLQC